MEYDMGRVWVWMDVCLRGDRLVSRDESAANGGEFVVRVSPAHLVERDVCHRRFWSFFHPEYSKKQIQIITLLSTNPVCSQPSAISFLPSSSLLLVVARRRRVVVVVVVVVVPDRRSSRSTNRPRRARPFVCSQQARFCSSVLTAKAFALARITYSLCCSRLSSCLLIAVTVTPVAHPPYACSPEHLVDPASC